jgi:hypothetical protein
MAYRVTLASAQRGDISTRWAPTRAAAIALMHELVDEIAAKERMHSWWRTEVISVRVEELGE